MSAVLNTKVRPAALLPTVFAIKLSIKAPILTHGSQSLDYGLDAAMQLYDGVPVISGSLIRGNLRHTWKRLLALQNAADTPFENQALKLTAADINRWLGEGSDEDSYNRPKRAHLNFDYFWVDEEKRAERKHALAQEAPDESSVAFINKVAAKVRHRIRINAVTGTVADGALQIIESPYDVGETPIFTGRIKAHVADEAERDKLTHWLHKGLQFLAAIGAMKGVGFGRVEAVHCARVDCVEADDSNAENCLLDQLKGKQRWPLRLTLDRPFCIAAPQVPNSNRFIGMHEIPGTVLKGALARTLEQYGCMALALEQGFDQWRFGYALPVNVGQQQRPIVKPLSLAVYKYKTHEQGSKETNWLDLALQDKAGLIENKNLAQAEYIVPSFVPDWKETDFQFIDATLSTLGHSLQAWPEHYLSVRTAVDLERNAAQQSALFSMECVDPNGFEWDCFIDFSACPQHLNALAEWLPGFIQRYGIQGLGKTKAQATLASYPVPSLLSPTDRLGPLDEHFYIVTLNTPALLLPKDIDLEQFPACDHTAALHQAYAEYFHHAADGKLQLSHFYAQQELAGGAFYWRYYRSQSEQPAGHYRPEFMTVAGSVFVLTATGQTDQSQVQAILKRWQGQGLPCTKSRENETWRSDPYRPEHGYGEVWINHLVHMDATQLNQSLAQTGAKGVAWHVLD